MGNAEPQAPPREAGRETLREGRAQQTLLQGILAHTNLGLILSCNKRDLEKDMNLPKGPTSCEWQSQR